MQSRETDAWKINGFFVLLFHMGLIASAIFTFGVVIRSDGALVPVLALIIHAVLLMFTLPGYFTIQPNETKALLFFGKYVGNVREPGFWWTNPFTSKQRVSLRVRNFASEQLKVNDAGGNPIEIACVVVWKAVDSYRALFDVDEYEEFVSIQSETALRGLAVKYPYDSHEGEDVSLRANPEEVASALKREVEERLEVAGVEVLETRLSHLAYAPEIAQAMLRRQQAQAIIAARRQIVEGAVGMVDHALDMLNEKDIVTLDEERKATMVNNLLVVLTSEQESQPVLNAGTLY